MDKGLRKAILAENNKHYLAKQGAVGKFILEYKKSVEIYNSNTGVMWDRLNLQSKIDPKFFPMAWDRTRIVANWLNKHKPNRVLNIGCGPGNLEKILLQNNSKIDWTGIDISKKSIRNLKENYPNAKFITRDALTIKKFGDKFDAIIALEVLEHISPKNTFRLLKSIYNNIHPRGYFICSVPTNEGLEKLLEKGKNPNGHVRIYTKSVLLTELHFCGFKTLKTHELFAFHNHYKLKTFVQKILNINNPNNLITINQKP